MRISILIVILLALVHTVGATVKNGILAGTVLDDATRQPLIGANVVIEGTTTGAATDTDGQFVINNLQPGSYNIGVYYLGYKTVLKNNVVIKPAATTLIRITMQPQILESEAVQVTAGYFTEPREAVVSARSMDFEEVRRSPGAALDIQRVMQSLPSVVSGSDQNNEIIIRGGNPGENLFILDGMEIPNPNHFGEFGTGGGPVNLINTLMVRDVDFYAGAFPARYGDKASSVMDIHLREGSREQFKATLDLGMAGAGALLEGPLDNGKGSYLVSARRSYLDLIVNSIGLVAVPQYYNMQAKVTWDLTPAHTLSFNAIYGRDNIKIEGEGTGGYNRGAENVTSVGGQYAAGIHLRSTLSPRLWGLTTLSLSHAEADIDVYELPSHRSKLTYFDQEEHRDLKSRWTYAPAKEWEVHFGASLKQVGFSSDYYREAATIDIYDVAGGHPDSVIGVARAYDELRYNRSMTGLRSALFAGLSYTLFNRFTLLAGVRYNYFDKNKKSTLSPRLGLRWRLLPGISLNAAYGRHFQNPHLRSFVENEQNSRLKPYYSDQYILGLEYLARDDIKMTLEAYHKTYSEIPVYKRLTTADPLDRYDDLMVNIGKGRAKGVEFFFQKKLTDRFSSIVSYAFSHSENNDPRDGSWYPGNYDYSHVLTLIGGYKIRFFKQEWFQKARESWWYNAFAFILPFSDETEFSIKYRYLGGRPYTEKVYHPEYKRWLVDETLALNQTRLPSYSRLDLRLDRRYFFDDWNMVTYLDMSNVLNHKNIWEYQYNYDGTKEEVLQFQPLLIGGINIEF